MQRPTIDVGESVECLRCGYQLAVLHRSVPQRSLALVIAALVLFVPANFLPIMQLTLLGRTTQDTIWSGVIGLYDSGMVAVAVIVFLCSLLIPFLKLLCQLAVLLSILSGLYRRTGLFLYRIYHHLRDWGMLEVYLLGILVAMIKLKDMAQLQLGVGLLCFVALLLVQLWLEVIMSPYQVWEELSVEKRSARD